ncbi:Transmembrane channel-like protein 7 [Araneus ventricosus]|uniref:Transmembrane channel-like protein 7 n=1 Tax=Araneus ventricosus TaxID=182803 RepID=A0A4Y2GS44_ARAVE|nr:Transmembrane channel-like protein 7 [Araneus ventricosus]
MSEKKDSSDSNVVESTSSVTEEKKSAHDEDEDVSNTASKESASSDEPSSLVFETDVSGVPKRLESRETLTRIINVEDRITDDEGNILHVASPTLVSQIKNIAPSINIFDKLVSEAVKEPSDTSLTSKSTSSTYVPPVKVVRFGSVRKLSIIPEIVNDDTAELDDQSTKEVIDKTIKKIPASMNVKRQRRNTLMILPKKTPWYTKLLNNLYNFSTTLYEYQLWHEHLKTIEGRFGASVVSYFLFIRWLVFMNIIILLLNFVFLVLPQFSLSHSQSKDFFNETSNHSKYHEWTFNDLQDNDYVEMYHENIYTIENILLTDIVTRSIKNKPSYNTSQIMKLVSYCRRRYRAEYSRMKYTGFLAKIQSLLDGRGWLESTLLFIGSYAKEGIHFFGLAYNVPLAFLWVFTISFIICFIMMVRYSSFELDETILTRQKPTSFANEVFSAWDFCIRTPKAAKLHHTSIVVTLKSELAEVRRKKELKERSFETWLKLYSIRVLMNILVIIWIAICYSLIYSVAVYQMNEQKKKKLQAAGFRTLIIQYLPPFTVTSISAVSPMFFNFLISFEKYQGQTEVNISLIRNVFLSLSSVIVLVNTFHREVTCTPKDVCGAGKGADCKTPVCWETYVGQQLYKLNLSQLFAIVASFVLVDVPRACFVKNWKNKFSRLIGQATFFLPTEVLVAVYSQTILWLGVFYSPLLPAVTVIKLIVLFYVKKTKVLQCSQQPKVLYKASRFNSTFIDILLLSFLAVLVVHFYTIGK